MGSFAINRSDRPALIIFDEDGSVEIHDGCHGQYMSISKMQKVFEYAENYIKEFQTDSAIHELNKNLIIEALAENVKKQEEYRSEAKPSAKSRIAPECFIYLIKDKVRGFYKIGKANNVHSRFSQLKTANPCIELIAFYRGVTTDEITIHSVLKGFGRHVDGEWFNLTDADIDYFHKYFVEIVF